MAISKKASIRKTSPEREAAGLQAADRGVQRQKAVSAAASETQNEIGRASCRESV